MDTLLNEAATLETAVILLIAVVVAFLIELLKSTKLRITEQMAHLLSLVLGITGGLIAMYLVQGDFASYVFVGLTGAIAAPGVYDLLIKRLGFSKGVDE